jgi:hypothetical protein
MGLIIKPYALEYCCTVLQKQLKVTIIIITTTINGVTAQSQALASLTAFVTVRYITMWVISPTINLF